MVFKVGGKAGPGRPPRVREDGYMQIMMRDCGFQQWAKITQKAIEQAGEGDANARAWLSKYLLPDYKPTDRPIDYGLPVDADDDALIIEAIRKVRIGEIGANDMLALMRAVAAKNVLLAKNDDGDRTVTQAELVRQLSVIDVEVN